jgi:hypothetical protein
MADEIERCLRTFYEAFSSPINTLLAQTLIASLLFGIGAAAYAQAEASNSNRENAPADAVYESSTTGCGNSASAPAPRHAFTGASGGPGSPPATTRCQS